MSRKRRPAPAETAVPAEQRSAREAEGLEALARQYPDEQEEILLDAAAVWSDAGQYDRALACYRQLLDGDCDQPDLIEAYRISTLWDAGRTGEAREAADRLRRGHPTDAGAWNTVAEMFESAGELHDAGDWFTAGITHLLGPTAPLTAAAVEDAADPGGIEMLAIGRHRVRRRLTQPHDELDRLADTLHENRPSLLRGPGTLDDLHAPEHLRAAESGDPEALQASIDRLTAELAARRAALSRPSMTCVLFWPEKEFSRLLATWPRFADDYGTEHREHIRGVEKSLRRLSEEGAVHLGIAQGDVADYERFTREERLSAEDEGARAEYAADLAARDRAQAWPPPRNGPCWCGSGRKYKKCCGNPAAT
ncbi:SEC-C domain-containing protein [Streptomyces minutiscleroticus]|uniref:Preprotein translocase SecA n=1 Tax=Streptomyces minutiscleroticus TaxID=68238 RepID=A0A918P098_9ACTN|nr:SEC-C metal-binding domain-containing protein [Streptomyces minutiscleroticus]GGY10915.1 preprotein translocase SecA [Streptomyces minutiscleroticus]